MQFTEIQPSTTRPGAAQVAQAEYGLRDILGILRRQNRLILLTIALLTGLAGFYCWLATPLYTAEALVLVDTSRRNILDPQQNFARPGGVEDARVNSEVEILRSAATALALVERFGLDKDPEFGPQAGRLDWLAQGFGLSTDATRTDAESRQEALRRFLKARDIRRRSGTFVISVSVSAQDPGRAAALSNALAQTYIDRQVATKVRNTLGTRDVLNARVVSAQNDLARSEDALDAFVRDNLDRLESASGSAELSQLMTSLELAERQKLDPQLAASRARSALDRADWQTVAAVLDTEPLTGLWQERESLTNRLNGSPGTAPANLRAELDRLDADLRATADAQLQRLLDRTSAFDRQIEALRQDIRTALARSEVSSDTLAAVFRLQQEAELARSTYQTLLARRSEVGAQATVQMADSQIVSEALPPAKASFPDTRLILMAALTGSAVLAVILAFAKEFYVGGVTSSGQLENLLPFRVCASVPAVPVAPRKESPADLVVNDPLSAYAESFRQIRAGLDRALSGVPERASPSGEQLGQIVLVSSSVSGEGKSTTALALARTYALSEKPTLLIDADLRRPSLHSHLGLAPGAGLLDFLGAPPDTPVRTSFFTRDPLSPLQVLLGSGRSPVPTDQLLSSRRFAALLAVARSHAELILIDSPPLVPVVDARYLAPHADAVLLLVQYAATRQSDLRLAAGQIGDAITPGTPILAALTHDIPSSSRNPYAEYYADTA